tara:strand:+ start:74 stop:322 length:249 start_codon:yes stop_codon:yes gene_type:complete
MEMYWWRDPQRLEYKKDCEYLQQLSNTVSLLWEQAYEHRLMGEEMSVDGCSTLEELLAHYKECEAFDNDYDKAMLLLRRLSY